MTILHSKNWFEVAKYDDSYTVFGVRSIPAHGLVAKESSCE